MAIIKYIYYNMLLLYYMCSLFLMNLIFSKNITRFFYRIINEVKTVMILKSSFAFFGDERSDNLILN